MPALERVSASSSASSSSSDNAPWSLSSSAASSSSVSTQLFLSSISTSSNSNSSGSSSNSKASSNSSSSSSSSATLGLAPKSKSIKKHWAFGLDAYEQGLAQGGRDLFSHQRECIDEMTRKIEQDPTVPSWMVFGGCGLGKTTVLAKTIKHLHVIHRLPQYVIYVVPEQDNVQSACDELKFCGMPTHIVGLKAKKASDGSLPLLPFKINVMKRGLLRDLFMEGRGSQREFILSILHNLLIV